MATKAQTTWVCDLCDKAVCVKQGVKPDGWAKLSVENPYLDRDWIEKCVCKDCAEVVKRSSASKN